MGGTRMDVLPVLGHEVSAGDILAGHVIAEVISPGRLRVNDEARTTIVVLPRDRVVVHRPAAVQTAERAECAFCRKSVALVEKGRGDEARMIFLPHGPLKARCAGTKLAPDEATVASMPALDVDEAVSA